MKLVSGPSWKESPSSYALALAASYSLFGATYIVLSGQVARYFADDLAGLAWIETAKGLAFVTTHAFAVFLLSRGFFARLAWSAEKVAQSRMALLDADRRAVPGLLASSVAHDFNNLLTVVRASLELRRQREGGPSDADLLAALDRATELSKTLSRAGRTSAAGSPSTSDAISVVREAVTLARHHPRAGGRGLTLDAPPTLTATTHPLLVHQIVTNLVINALEATPAGGSVRVTVAPAEGGLTIEVEDTGPGIDPSVEGSLFAPFVTTKPAGTGLGLLSVRTAAELHDGSVTAGRSSELGGAHFRVRLRTPRATA